MNNTMQNVDLPAIENELKQIRLEMKAQGYPLWNENPNRKEFNDMVRVFVEVHDDPSHRFAGIGDLPYRGDASSLYEFELTKACMKCEQIKPIYCFSFNKWTKDGRNYACKPCTAEVQRKKRYRLST